MDAIDRLNIALGGKWIALQYMGAQEPRVIEAILDGDASEAAVLISTGVESAGVDIENVTLEDFTFWPSRDACQEFCDQQNALPKASSEDEAEG